jgi:hypothetical protein
MGLESLPHLALGNTKKGMTQIVIGGDGGSNDGLSHAEWFIKQKDDIKEQAHETGRHLVARHTKTINSMCKASSKFLPTINSLAYFSEIEELTSSRRQSKVLMSTKNPVGFGAMVFEEARNTIYQLGGRASYYAPSDFVGLEFAKKGLLIKNKFKINWSSNEAGNYADAYEYNLKELDSVIADINFVLAAFTNEALASKQDVVRDAVEKVLDAYHVYMKEGVEAGISYTAIEDKWLNKKIVSARAFAPVMMGLYDYAESNEVAYDTAYPSYKNKAGEDFMNEQLAKTNENQYALYSEVFENIKAKSVTSSSGNKYQVGHIISQNAYMKKLIIDLKGFHRYITSNWEVEALRSISIR